MKIKAVLFDLDGTLVDTTEFIFQAYSHALSLHGFKFPERTLLTSLIGQRLDMIYKQIAPSGDLKLLIEEHFKFQAKNFHLVKNYPNVLEVINKLKKMGIKLGIVTTRLGNTDDTLKAVGINPNLFDVIIRGHEVQNPKPDPEGAILALKALKVKPSQALLVGDSSADMQMGKSAKVKTVGVTWGFGGENIKNSKPDYVVDNIKELLRIVE